MAEPRYWVTSIRMTASAEFLLMRVAVGSFQLIIGLRLSIRSPPPSKMRARQQPG